MYLADLKEKTTALELTDEADEYSTSVRFSPDGKTVYFTDPDNTLYGISVAELKKGGKPERISRDVSTFSVLKDGRILYIQRSDNENRLSIYEKGETFRLLKGYYMYQLSDDQKTIYYTERDESDNTIALYKMAMTKDAKEERLLKGATTIYSDWDAGTLVYGVDENEMNGYSTSISNSLTVYSCTPGGDKTKLVSDVYSIAGMTVDGGKVSFYYWVEDVEERTLYDFVTDAKADEDAVILAEGEPEEPLEGYYAPVNWWVEDAAGNVLYDYLTGERSETYYGYYQDDWTYYYEDIMGDSYPIDLSQFDEGRLDGPFRHEIMVNFVDSHGGISAPGRDFVEERYEEAYEECSAQYDVWYAAQNREYIRQELKETQYGQTSYSLYHYTGSDKGEPIATGVNGSGRASSASDGIFLYHKVGEDGGKVADVADLGYSGEIYDYLNSNSGADEVWYQNVGGKESVIDLDDVVSVYSIYVLNGKEVVLDVYDGDEESLRAYSLGKDALTFTSTIIEGDDFSGPHRGKSGGKDVLYLFTDTEDEDYNTLGDFCVYRDGKLETIAKEVYDAVVLDESGTIYVVTDIDTRNGSTELAVMKDGKPVTVSDEISGSEPVFLDGSQILYIADGDLMLWNGKEERRIARDVVSFWASVQEGCSTYSAY